jgi:hypothetical protein
MDDSRMALHEAEDRLVQLIADKVVRLLRDIDEIEGRLDLVERTVRGSLLN